MSHSNCHCCPHSNHENQTAKSKSDWDLTRRNFLATMTAGGALLSNVSWSILAAENENDFSLMPSARKPLVVLPILVYDIPQRQPMVSWRGWGGIDSKESAAEEVDRITKELDGICATADFPVEFLPILSVNHVNQAKDHPAVAQADAIIVYGAGGGVDGVQHFGKDVIIFQRWKSGPVYLQYEIVSPRLLRQHTDSLKLDNIRFDDVVTDSLDELTWRLRSLCGLKNTKNTRILAVGGADAWAQPAESQKILFDNLKNQWNLDIQTVDYDKLGKLLADAQQDQKILQWAKQKTENYLKIPNTKLDTEKEFVVNCFILDYIFRHLMKEADCKAITILGCMTTIIPQAKTTACLTLSLLNDDGYLAFCESDFAVIPSGILLANICGHPVFLNDPTYPHDQIVTLAHCTAPRKLDGKNYEPAQIVTHFESDYGAAPKVDFKLNETATCILPDFHSVRWAGFRSKTVDNPFKPICRSQIDVQYTISDSIIAERMPGFHWMFGYGDYMKEIGYALRRVGIQWDNLEE
ncbi:MAG: sugar isomerase [Planctomycetia bacterium]|nr:sugar isomerase [Planctomycetia bacterium]